jgi:hypothetical protein
VLLTYSFKVEKLLCAIFGFYFFMEENQRFFKYSAFEVGLLNKPDSQQFETANFQSAFSCC